jgi:Icc protein
MPFHLAHDRRAFLAASATGIFAFAARGATPKDYPVDEDLVYILNDTHISEKHPPDSSIPSHLKQVVAEIIAEPRKPIAVIINGDLALTDGQPGDYIHFAKLIAPLHKAGVATHLTLGNHDNREAFYDVMTEQQSKPPFVESRHISVVKTRHANFFLLDSLQKTMVTQGTIGPEQLHWLTKALDEHSGLPAIIVAHHNPRLGGDPNHFPGGLIDSPELWAVLKDRTHVKAYIHGHIHDRTNAQHHGIHILNTLATSYVANKKLSTTGWTTAKLSPSSIQLTTHTNEADHPWNGDRQTLLWRI